MSFFFVFFDYLRGGSSDSEMFNRRQSLFFGIATPLLGSSSTLDISSSFFASRYF